MGVPRYARALMLVLALVASTALGGTAAALQPTAAPVAADAPDPSLDPTTDPVLAAAGDIACDPLSLKYNSGLGTATACRQQFTSDLLTDPSVTAVATLGDNAYHCGATGSYQDSYAPTWGRVLAETHPSTGNHDYFVSGDAKATTGCTTANKGAQGYFGYFGANAGEAGKGWYSYDLGAWHVVVLNSNCSQVGGCKATDPQGQWLAQDLADHQTSCTLAYWHHPLFAAGDTAATETKPFWDLLYQYHADLVLNGHRHWYERLAPVTPAGVIDPATGIREFVVGTGGEDHQGDSTRGPLSELYNNATFGVIKVALHPTGYDWQFVPESGETFTDSGTGSCHGPSADTAAPAVPTGLSATASTGPNKVDLSWSPSTDDTAVEGYRIFRNGAPVGYTTTGTAWTDTRAAAGVTYSYTVQAYDTTGNQSGPSDPAVATIPGGSTVITIPAAADGRVLSGQPNRNYGTVSPLIVDGTPKLRSFLRFDTSGLAGRTVVSAKLRLWCTNGSPSGGTVYGTDGTSWTETGLTWNTMPGLGSLVANLGAVTASSSRQVDVTPLVTGSGTVDLAIVSTNADDAAYLSRETTNANRRPALVVTVR